MIKCKIMLHSHQCINELWLWYINGYSVKSREWFSLSFLLGLTLRTPTAAGKLGTVILRGNAWTQYNDTYQIAFSTVYVQLTHNRGFFEGTRQDGYFDIIRCICLFNCKKTRKIT